jgi:hypothetical protein
MEPLIERFAAIAATMRLASRSTPEIVSDVIE